MSLANWAEVATLGGRNVTRRKVCEKYQKRVIMYLVRFFLGSPGEYSKWQWDSMVFIYIVIILFADLLFINVVISFYYLV